MIIVRVLVWIFGLWILSQIIFKFRDKKLSLGGLIFWIILWVVIIGTVSQPQITDQIAKIVGVGRGTDVALFFAILILIVLMFRFYLKITEVESQISDIVKHIAILTPKRGRKRKR